MPKLTPEQIAEIETRLEILPEPDMSDPDNPEWTAELFARAKPPEDIPALAGFLAKKGGRPRKDQPKIPVTIRLDADIVEHFKSGGQGWQSRINAMLADDIKAGRG